MFSIRNMVALGLITSCLVGCQWKQSGQPATLNDKPIPVDGAMQARDWDATHAYYANGKTPAYADRFNLEPADATVEDWGWATETPIFVANSVIWPFTYITTPPFTKVDHPSVETPVTYTAMPVTETIPPYGLEKGAGQGHAGSLAASK